LYLVNKTYYYRRKIKQKLFRISLHTKCLKTALKIKRVLDLLKEEDMFKLETKDFKLFFEYDTEEELKTALENAMQMQVQAQVQRFKEAKQHLEYEAQEKLKEEQKHITFMQLKDKYFAKKRANGETTGSISEYVATFNKLVKFFKDKNVYELKEEDLDQFKEYLNTLIFRGDNLSKNTINKHLIYLKMFLKFIHLNNLADTILLYKKKTVKKETPKKINYTKSEIKNILKGDYANKDMELIMKIALYGGLRQGEIRELTQNNIKQDKESNIYYFDIGDTKSEAGNRKVPIHKNILNEVLEATFPLLGGLNKNTFGKKVRYALYKIVKVEGKNFHTLRANMIDNIIKNNEQSNNQFALYIIQEIVGHSAEDKVALTTQTYKKGWDLATKQEFVNNISY